jgi:signal peptidase I
MSSRVDDFESTAAPAPTAAPRRHRHWLFGWTLVIVIAAVVSIVLRLFVVQTFFVPTGSMIPTLQEGDRILVQKIGFSLQRGAIVVFEHPKGDPEPPLNEDLVKRIIGLPGDTIWSQGNTVYIDGKPLAEPWLPKGTVLGGAIKRQTIPKGEYFMMGDNRSDSYDSRDWGPIAGNTIIGRVFLIVWRHGHPTFTLP